MASVDLHTHSTASDGLLSPTALVGQAHAAGVRLLALTDHDTVSGVPEAARASRAQGLHLIAGIELSAHYGGQAVHIVGLDLDPAAPPLGVIIERLALVRRRRAAAIGARLSAQGYANALTGACQLAGHDTPGRAHFARWMVDQGHSESAAAAFRRHLGRGKSAYVATPWPDIEVVLAAIHHSGGISVLAHPGRYARTSSRLRRLVGGFSSLGGMAMEVSHGVHDPSGDRRSAAICAQAGLLASTGSDFHAPDLAWMGLGRLPPLPAGLTPVWDRFRN